MSQSWPIPQLINKSSGTCSVCLATRQIHIRDGTVVHKHGPRHDLCPGSNKPPLQNGSQPLDSSTSRVQTSLDNSGPPSADPMPSIGILQPQSKGFVPIWSVTSTAVIKRIPKASRHACTSHLASLLRKVFANPGSSSGWLDLFNWSQAVLRAPNVVGNGITCLQPLNTGFLPSLRSSQINTSAAFPMSRYIQNHPLAKQFQPNWKMEMSELLCVFYCQMTVRLPLHLSRTKPCRRNIHLLLSICPTYLDLMFSGVSQ